jgi:hypothetical protein
MSAPQRYKVVFAAVLSIASPAWASSILEIPIVNPGAETGDLTGWTDPNGVWQASQSFPALEGNSYFVTDHFLFPSLQPLSQTLDLRQYTGQIIDIKARFVMSADYGLAIPNSPGGTGTWEYYPKFNMVVADSLGQFLFSIGWLERGRSHFMWIGGILDFSIISDWPARRENIGFITMNLESVWFNQTTGNFTSILPDATVVDAPSFTAFDNISLTLTIPEPSSMLSLALFALFLRSRSRQTGRAKGN